MNLQRDATSLSTSSMRKLRFAAGLVALVLTATVATAASTDSFTASYSGGSDASCTTTYSIAGVEPNDGLKHPVFLYTVGTWETYDNGSAMAAVNGMAARGYVAATVEYPNGSFGDCGKLGLRTQCIYNPANPSSAVSAVCARASADCSKGIVVGGFSQGSVVATLARNYNSNVQAAYGIGDGVRYSIYNLNRCMASGQYSLPSDHLRVVNGIHDQFLGPSSKGAYSQSRSVTGLDCPDGTTGCFRSNGSGWYVVQDSEVEDGLAEHCYMYIRHGLQDSCPDSEDSLDTGWTSGSDAWELNANLDWLSGFAQQ